MAPIGVIASGNARPSLYNKAVIPPWTWTGVTVKGIETGIVAHENAPVQETEFVMMAKSTAACRFVDLPGIEELQETVPLLKVKGVAVPLDVDLLRHKAVMDGQTDYQIDLLIMAIVASRKGWACDQAQAIGYSPPQSHSW